MATVTKAALVESLFVEFGLNKKEAKVLVDLLFEEMVSSLIKGHPIRLSGLGNFDIKEKTARPGRNPKTLKEAVIAPRRVVTFKTGHKLKTLLDSQELQA